MRRAISLFICVLLVASAPLAAAPSLAQIRVHLIEWEGYKDVPYRDGIGYSVGIGHSITANKQRPKARYSKAEIEGFFLQDASWAIDSARKNVRDFDNLPDDIQLLTLGVVWTVGRTGFARFKEFRFALSHRMWNAARTTLYHSKWRTQVSQRRVSAYLRILDSQP